jgi:hypothetical protein
MAKREPRKKRPLNAMAMDGPWKERKKLTTYIATIAKNVRTRMASNTLTMVDAIKNCIPKLDAFLLEQLPVSSGRATAIRIVKGNPNLVFLIKRGTMSLPEEVLNMVIPAISALGGDYVRAGGDIKRIKPSIKVLQDARGAVESGRRDGMEKALKKQAKGLILPVKELNAIKTIYALRMEQLLGKENYSLFIRASKAAQPLLRKAVTGH